jgi:hypothetical protein
VPLVGSASAINFTKETPFYSFTVYHMYSDSLRVKMYYNSILCIVACIFPCKKLGEIVFFFKIEKKKILMSFYASP